MEHTIGSISEMRKQEICQNAFFNWSWVTGSV